MTDTEIDAALALCKAATPGPWRLRKQGFASDVAGIVTPDDPRPTHGMDYKNAKFCAAARTGWPAALLALREARELVEYHLIERHKVENEAACARELAGEVARLREALGEAIQGVEDPEVIGRLTPLLATDYSGRHGL